MIRTIMITIMVDGIEAEGDMIDILNRDLSINMVHRTEDPEVRELLQAQMMMDQILARLELRHLEEGRTKRLMIAVQIERLGKHLQETNPAV